MRAVHRILVPVDFSPESQNALRYALQYADQIGAQVTVLHVVVPQVEAVDATVMVNPAIGHLIDAARTGMQQWVAATIAQVQAQQPASELSACKQLVEVGMITATINRIADREAADLILLATQGERRRIDRLFGTVTAGVVRTADCPTLIVPWEGKFRAARQVLYATELKREDLYYVWLILKKFVAETVEFRCVHVHTSVEKTPEISPDDLREFVADLQPELACTAFGIRSDAVTQTLQEVAESFRVDLLVMHRPQHHWLHRLAFRSNTVDMAFLTHAPLLILR